MTKAIAQTYTVAKDFRKEIAYFVLAACAGMMLVYGLNLYKVVTQTIALRSVQSEEVAVESSLSDLNAKYLDLSSQITPDALRQYGFNQGQVAEYITRNSSLNSFALR